MRGVSWECLTLHTVDFAHLWFPSGGAIERHAKDERSRSVDEDVFVAKHDIAALDMLPEMVAKVRAQGASNGILGTDCSTIRIVRTATWIAKKSVVILCVFRSDVLCVIE